MSSKNGHRALPGAVHSIGIDSAAEPIPQAKVTQAISSRALPAGWLQGVCSDVRIGILHRLALVGLGLHRYRNDSGLDAVASEIGVDRVTVLLRRAP